MEGFGDGSCFSRCKVGEKRERGWKGTQPLSKSRLLISIMGSVKCMGAVTKDPLGCGKIVEFLSYLFVI